MLYRKSNIKDKIFNVQWFRYAQRFSTDFSLILVNYFLEGHKKYLLFKNLLYINKGQKVHAFRDKIEIGVFYKKIRRFKKNDFITVAKETRTIVQKVNSFLDTISLINLSKLNNNKLKKHFSKFSSYFYKFAAYFIYSQYIGQVFRNDPKILGYYDKETLRIIRFKPIISEVNKKLNIYFKIIGKRVPIKHSLLHWLYPKEIEKLLTTKRKKLAIKLQQDAKSRKNKYLFILLNGQKLFYTNKDEIKIAEKLLKMDKSLSKTEGIEGKIAYRGYVEGIAKIVSGKKDFKKISKGNILVAVFVMPYFLPIIKKSGAVITDEGGLLSHASIMSRELRKPCIIDTKIATTVLEDGDKILVDANRGIIKKL